MSNPLISKRKERAKALLRELKKLFPNPKIALKYKTNWELLVAVILSAQCTDKKVNEVTQNLFKKYKTLNDYVNASASQQAINEFEQDIRSTGFFRNKTKNILATAKIVKKKFKGKVPSTMKELLSLPGVARKTANIVLSDGFGIIEGIAVDTHVKRLTRRFGLTDESDPVKIELDLMELLPRKDWRNFSHQLIFYGRKYCPARSCPSDHPLNKFDLMQK